MNASKAIASYHLGAGAVVVAGFSGPAAGDAPGPSGVVAGGGGGGGGSACAGATGGAAGVTAAGGGAAGAGGGGGGAGACADAIDSPAIINEPTNAIRKLRVFMAFSSESPHRANTSPNARQKTHANAEAHRTGQV